VENFSSSVSFNHFVDIRTIGNAFKKECGGEPTLGFAYDIKDVIGILPALLRASSATCPFHITVVAARIIIYGVS
jgi:hypothetical protein